jgi:hypothetical protein
MKPSLADFKIDESKYKKVTDPHLLNIAYYNNEEEGVSFAVDGNLGVVNNITYFPAARHNHQRCSNSAAKNSDESINDGLTTSQKFDEYSSISFAQEKERLDQFAIALVEQQRRESGTRGYVIAYAGRRARVDEAKARAERAKRYLINERGIKAGHIITIDGGHREDLMVELYLAPHGTPAPTATPTVIPNDVQIITDNNTRNNKRHSSRQGKQRPLCQ